MVTGRAAQLLGVGVAAVWLVSGVVLDLIVNPSTAIFISLFSMSALIACAVLSARVTAVFAVAAAAAAVGAGWWDGTWDSDFGLQLVFVVNAGLVGGAAVVIASVRVRREQTYTRAVAIADIAQRAILPAVPPIVGHVAVGTRYLSAADDALVGGDLYDYYYDDATTRFLVGDVRGKGLDAVEQAARVIRSFRQSASSVADLPEVAKSMTAYLAPFLDDEEFVTALLVDVSDPTHLTLVSCGHPQPLLSTKGGPARLLELPAGLPLGLADSYTAVKVPWRPGDRLLMYTDGVSEARDANGEFFPPMNLADPMTNQDVAQALDDALEAVHRHVRNGRLVDDLAVVLLENCDRPVAGEPQRE